VLCFWFLDYFVLWSLRWLGVSLMSLVIECLVSLLFVVFIDRLYFVLCGGFALFGVSVCFAVSWVDFGL